MRLDGEDESDNIEDMRGQGGGGFNMPGLGGVGGGGGGLQLGGRGMGFGSIIIIGILALVFGINPLSLLGGGDGPAGGPPQQIGQPQIDTALRPASETDRFVARVLGTTERTWAEIFPREVGEAYREPKLVLFSGSVRSACGQAQSAMGPFYCPADQKVYLDQSFFDELSRRFGAPGDFAAAYVIAHEVGHHIQTLLGISQQVSAAQDRASRSEGNALSVRLELQADCLAGVWANRNQQLLEPGDVEEAMRAATAIGDDALQRAAQGVVVPESFTHGSSEQRTRWFTRGMQEGTIAACDTFRAREV